MIATDQLCANDFGNVGEALVVQQSIYFLSAIFHALFSDFFSHLILFLQLREPQPHASDTGLLVGSLSGQVATKFIPELTKPWEDMSSTKGDLVEKKKAVR